MIAKAPILKSELTNTVQGLRAVQSFSVIFMRPDGCSSLDEDYLPMATPDNKAKAVEFINAMKPSGKTDPLPAIRAAFKLKPQRIYLLGDHHFSDGAAVLKLISDLNTDHKVQIHSIAFLDKKDDEPELMELFKKIAAEYDGVFKLTTPADL
jgi:hypothetical protein